MWARDSVLDLIRQFIHEVEDEDGEGRRTKRLIFPRYQQLDAVRRMVSHARSHGAGQRYLIQHSAGSGKSYTIAWLAHQLSTLHDVEDRSVFDSIVVVTDRRVLDRQLQHAITQFEQTLGVVENIDRTSRQLRQALESGKRIIVTTLQKFPVIAEEIGSLPGQRFAVIVDEAHSSQSGESSKSLKSVLAAGSLEAAEEEEAGAATPEEELEATVLAEMERRGPLPNLSTFAFTATPKAKTLELFGVRQADGRFEPFHLYSMRQAIEEGFILDVLANYTTYSAYWRLFKTIEDDPRYEKGKAAYLLKSFVELHPHAIGRKVKIMVDHFAGQVQDRIGGRAKAMIVTRSRLHAVRYKLAVDAYLAEKGYPWKCLVAFSGKVSDGGKEYTEPGMNSAGGPHPIGEQQTAAEFAKPEYRFLVVASKFQTGFDQPLLHTMYVDKKLGGVNAVQTLSRLNRKHPGKDETAVLDFANEADHIREAFEPYYETTLLSEATDPNLLYDLQRELLDFHVYTEAEVDAFAQVYFGENATQDQLYAALADAVQRYRDLEPEVRSEFRGGLRKYTRLYSFLAQVLTFTDADLEKLHVFARYLRQLLPGDGTELPREVQRNIDMESYRIQQTGQGGIELSRGSGTIDPRKTGIHPGGSQEEIEALSRIIAELNDRFGLNLGPEHRVTLRQMMDKLEGDAALDAAARVNTRENVRLTFDHKVEEVIQDNRRLELRPLQANHRRPRVRRTREDAPLRPVPPRPPERRGVDQARRVEDAGVQVNPTLEPQGGPQGQPRDPRRPEDDRGLPEHRGRRPPPRRRRRRVGRRHRTGRLRQRRQVHAPSGPGRAARVGRPRRDVHRPKDRDPGRRHGVRGELPAKPGARLPLLEELREHRPRRLLRPQRPGDCQAAGAERGRVH